MASFEETLLLRLEGMARCAGKLLAPAEGLGPDMFPLLPKSCFLMMLWPILVTLCVTLMMFRSTLTNFERRKKSKKIPKL